jgi:hypothetical protein
MFVPLAPAAQNLGVGLQRPCREKFVWRHAQGNGRRERGSGRQGAKYRSANQHPRIFHSTRETAPSSSAYNFRVDKGFGEMGVRCQHHQIPKFDVQPSSNFSDPHCSAASLEVNSEPHTGARPSVRLCVGLIKGHMRARRRIFVLGNSHSQFYEFDHSNMENLKIVH